MAELELLEYYKKMCERHIVLDFQGAMSQDMLVGMAELIKNKSVHDSQRTSTVKKVFAVFIEMAQNIAHYSSERVHMSGNPSGNGVGAGIIVVTEAENIFTITSGNMVKTNLTPAIIKHCQTINQMDKEELKQFYKQQIKGARETGKRGAGVGLIDIARKSGDSIKYQVDSLDDEHSFLVLSVKINEEIKNG
ncbi:MAG: hypothetical protein GY940_25260 [bacterium]|nr:hypothetical protein [bacterium]